MSIKNEVIIREKKSEERVLSCGFSSCYFFPEGSDDLFSSDLGSHPIYGVDHEIDLCD